METYDMKPDAPAEYRGDFRPIQTNVPGIDVCEQLPLHAKVADKFTPHPLDRPQLRRPRRRPQAASSPAAIRSQPTGFVNDYPDGRLDGRQGAGRTARRGVPNYVAGTDAGRDGIDVFSFGSAYLGPATHPFTVAGDPSAAELPGPQPRRRRRRRERLRRARCSCSSGLDTAPPAIDRSGTMAAMDDVRAAGPGPADDRRGPQGVRPVARAGHAARALRHARLGPAGPAGPAAGRAGASFVTMVMENPYQSGVPMPEGRHLQLGLARRQLPHLQRRQGPPAALRPGGDGADRRPATPAGWTRRCC